ncbi:sulfur reduction protein DsrE [Mesorhizobium sp. Root695]|uniref:DsrE family protein n=1 Tax=unclassified Mesorhizobium TaxID=325217 RepID=UPI0006F34D13|nr:MULTISPECIES: DsrE family protein [unclassified Mesorhizobium]KQU83322.1 sulfur reduction protein DsrE [Mesorhizobium sp. Root102]KRB33477.1 sulfur reduction protein DsrE [Mesorhizobium sp. Root695]
MNTSIRTLHIDIPVVLAEVKMVFSISALAFEGDLPASLFHLQLVVDDVADWGAQSDLVAVFHTNAGHVMLHDKAYDGNRNITTGNPYKGLVADLVKRGVRVELCGATAKAHGWVNADLLPDIKVNTDAMARTAQLVQQGFVKISE